jgi:hypothetical protein
MWGFTTEIPKEQLFLAEYQSIQREVGLNEKFAIIFLVPIDVIKQPGNRRRPNDSD